MNRRLEQRLQDPTPHPPAIDPDTGVLIELPPLEPIPTPPPAAKTRDFRKVRLLRDRRGV